MFRFPMVKQLYFNSALNDFCLKLTKESINKYVKKIEDISKNKNKDKNMDLVLSLENPNNPNNPNNPYFFITCIGIFYFASIYYYFYKSKSK